MHQPFFRVVTYATGAQGRRCQTGDATTFAFLHHQASSYQSLSGFIKNGIDISAHVSFKRSFTLLKKRSM